MSLTIPKKIKIVCVRSVAAGPLRRPYPLPLAAVGNVGTPTSKRQAAGGRRQAAGGRRHDVTRRYTSNLGHFGQHPSKSIIGSAIWRRVRWRAPMGSVGTLGTFQGTHHIAPTAHYIPPYEIQISKPENTDRHPKYPPPSMIVTDSHTHRATHRDAHRRPTSSGLPLVAFCKALLYD